MMIFKLIFNCFLTLVSFLIPKSKQYVIVGGWYGERYADNSKGIYMYLNTHKKQLGLKRIFWYTKNEKIYKELSAKNMDVLMGIGFKSIYYHLRSKTHIIDQNPHDILGFLSVRCVRLNLWHGFPLKKIGYLITNEVSNVNFWRKFSSGGFWRDHYLLATSELSRELLSRAMGISKDKCIIASYPRTDELYNKSAKMVNKGEFYVLYLPTLRGKSEMNPLLNADLDKLNERFRKEHIYLSIKPHFASIGHWKSIKGYSNFKLLDAALDVYDLLGQVDLLITDYSSVHFDYLITGKALLFFPYDYEYYLNEDRGFSVSYDDYTPGEKVYNVDELINKIGYIKNNYDTYKTKYEKQYQWVDKQVNMCRKKADYEMIINLVRN